MSSTGNPPKRRRHMLFIFLAVFLIVVGITASVLKISEIISNLGAVFTVFGVLLAIFPGRLPTHSPLTWPHESLADGHDQESRYVRIEGVTPTTLGLGRGRGAIVVYSRGELLGSYINLIYGFDRSEAKPDIVEHIIRRKVNNRAVFVAIFQGLPVGKYTLCSVSLGLKENVTVRGGEVKEIDCRRRTRRYMVQQ